MNQRQLILKKAECLNDVFVRQTRVDVDDNTSGHFDDVQDANNMHRINKIRLNDMEVKDVLLSLDPGTATGPNGISNKILRECASELASPLCDIFNASLSSSTVPFSWKQANVCAVHKKDDKSCANNYRPISLCCVEKVFERRIFKRMFSFLQENNVLTSFQSVSIPGDSSVNQLTFLYNVFVKPLTTD